MIPSYDTIETIMATWNKLRKYIRSHQKKFLYPLERLSNILQYVCVDTLEL